MKVRPGGIAGGADITDQSAPLNSLADKDLDLAQMAVSGCQSVTMIECYQVAQAAIIMSGKFDLAVGGGINRGTGPIGNVNTGVELLVAGERIIFHPKATALGAMSWGY